MLVLELELDGGCESGLKKSLIGEMLVEREKRNEKGLLAGSSARRCGLGRVGTVFHSQRNLSSCSLQTFKCNSVAKFGDSDNWRFAFLDKLPKA